MMFLTEVKAGLLSFRKRLFCRTENRPSEKVILNNYENNRFFTFMFSSILVKFM